MEVIMVKKRLLERGNSGFNAGRGKEPVEQGETKDVSKREGRRGWDLNQR